LWVRVPQGLPRCVKLYEPRFDGTAQLSMWTHVAVEGVPSLVIVKSM
jgi:hypothetical protein